MRGDITCHFFGALGIIAWNLRAQMHQALYGLITVAFDTHDRDAGFERRLPKLSDGCAWYHTAR